MNPAMPSETQWQATAEKLNEAVRRIVAAASPRKIILFGSRARADARPDSDVDLMVVEDEITDRGAEMVRLRGLLTKLRLPVDVLVVSREKFDYWSDTPGNVYFEARAEGKVLYEAA